MILPLEFLCNLHSCKKYNQKQDKESTFKTVIVSQDQKMGLGRGQRRL